MCNFLNMCSSSLQHIRTLHAGTNNATVHNWKQVEYCYTTHILWLRYHISAVGWVTDGQAVVSGVRQLKLFTQYLNVLEQFWCCGSPHCVTCQEVALIFFNESTSSLQYSSNWHAVSVFDQLSCKCWWQFWPLLKKANYTKARNKWQFKCILSALTYAIRVIIIIWIVRKRYIHVEYLNGTKMHQIVNIFLYIN